MTFFPSHREDVNIEEIECEERNFTTSDEEKVRDDVEQHEIMWKGFYDPSHEKVGTEEDYRLSDEELEEKLAKFDRECEEIALLNKMQQLKEEKEEDSSSSEDDASNCEHIGSTKIYYKKLDISNCPEADVKLENLDGEGENEVYVRNDEELTLTESDDGNRDYRELLLWNIEPRPTNRFMLLPIQRKTQEEEPEDEKEEKEWKEYAVTPIPQKYKEEVSEDSTDIFFKTCNIPKFDRPDDIVTKFINTETIEKPDGTKIDNTVIMTTSISEIRAKMAEFRKSLDDFNERCKVAAAEIFQSYNDSLPIKPPIRPNPKVEEVKKVEKRKEILAYINKDLSDPEESKRSFDHIREMLKMITVNAEDYEKSKALEAMEAEEIAAEKEVEAMEIKEECEALFSNDEMTCSLEMKLAKIDN